LEINKIFKI